MLVVNNCAKGDERKLGQHGKGGMSHPEQSTPRGDSIPLLTCPPSSHQLRNLYQEKGGGARKQCETL